MTKALHGLYAITDSQLMPSQASLIQHVEQSLVGGAAIIQYRDKSEEHEKRIKQAYALKQLCNRFKVPLIINDDITLAKEISADGVHLGQTDGGVTNARKLLGEDAIIGVTCHDQLSLAVKAESEGADYVAFGAFFPSQTKPNASPAPISLLQQASAKINLPIVAIGGISVDNAHQVIKAGADMVAVIHALYAQTDVADTAQQFNQLFSS